MTSRSLDRLIPHQLFLDVSELVPSIDSFDPADFAPRGDRADGQRIVLGEKTNQLLAKGSLFMIGAFLFASLPS